MGAVAVLVWYSGCVEGLGRGGLRLLLSFPIVVIYGILLLCIFQHSIILSMVSLDV